MNLDAYYINRHLLYCEMYLWCEDVCVTFVVRNTCMMTCDIWWHIGKCARINIYVMCIWICMTDCNLCQSYPMPGKVKVVQIIPENNERNVQILVFSPFSNSSTIQINRLHRLEFCIAVGTANLCYYLARSGELNSRRCKVNISMPGKKFPCTK